jgi:hypothetical protein
LSEGQEGAPRSKRQQDFWLRFLNNSQYVRDFAGFSLKFTGKKLRCRSASLIMVLLDCIGRSRTIVLAKAAAW